MTTLVIDKPGRYRTRCGELAFVVAKMKRTNLVIYEDRLIGQVFTNGLRFGSAHESKDDLVEYLGPLEPGDDGFPFSKPVHEIVANIVKKHADEFEAKALAQAEDEARTLLAEARLNRWEHITVDIMKRYPHMRR